MVIGGLIFLAQIIQFLLYPKIPKDAFNYGDTLIAILLLLILFSGIIHTNSKTLNYIGTYLFIFLILYFFLKLSFIKQNSAEYFLRINFYAIVFLCSFLIVEFMLKYLFSINIQDFLPRRRETTATFLGTFPRSYGFSTEPGVVAYYLTTMGMVAFYYVFEKSRLSKLKKAAFVLLFLFAEISIYSTTGITALIVAWITTNILLPIKSDKIRLNKYSLFIIISIFLLFIFKFNEIFSLFSPIINKLSLIGASSAIDRRERWLNALNMISDNPLTGIGIGGLSAQGKPSPINWYLFLGVETGILTVIVLWGFYIYVLVKMLYSKLNGKKYFLIGFIGATIHLFAISSFQYPFIFLLLIFFFSTNYSNKHYENSLYNK